MTFTIAVVQEPQGILFLVIMGNQGARTGNGYAGFFATQGYFVTREYLHAQLSSPLIAGKQYCVSFYLVLADNADSWGFQNDVAVNDIGAYIGSTATLGNIVKRNN